MQATRQIILKMRLIILIGILCLQLPMWAQEALLKNGRSVVYTGQKRELEPEENEFFQTMVLKTSNTFSKCTPEGYVLSGKWLPDYEEVYRSQTLDKENRPIAFELVLKWSPIDKESSQKDVLMKVMVNTTNKSFNAIAPFKSVKDSLYTSWSQTALSWTGGITATNYKGNGRVLILGNWETPLKPANMLNLKAKWPKPSFNMVNNIVVLVGGEEAIIQEMLEKIPQDRLKSLLNYRENWP